MTMPTSATRETAALRTLLALEAAQLRGWDRERIMTSLGISRATYYRLSGQLSGNRDVGRTSEPAPPPRSQ